MKFDTTRSSPFRLCRIPVEIPGPILSVGQLPSDLLRYTLPSRYCDSDKLMNFAWNQFGQVPHGLDRVQAICDWVHNNIEYRFGSGRPDLSASEVIARGFGVCRDFAHAAIALCRAFNLPARYVTGHLPDIGHTDPGTPMDFHAYCEVSVWARTGSPLIHGFNVPRIGRVKVAHGADAVDGAFATIYGEANLNHFEVWAYQVNPQQVSVGDPIDLSKRLDGTQTVRLGEFPEVPPGPSPGCANPKSGGYCGMKKLMILLVSSLAFVGLLPPLIIATWAPLAAMSSVTAAVSWLPSRAGLQPWDDPAARRAPQWPRRYWHDDQLPLIDPAAKNGILHQTSSWLALNATPIN